MSVPAAATPDTTGISYDVSRGVIEGTSDDMEYSFDNTTWYNVSQGGTTQNVQFKEGTLYIHTKATSSALASTTTTLGVIYAPAAAPTLIKDDTAN